MSKSLLKVRNIETFYGPVMAIKGVSFDVDEGAIVALLGANGAGKSTILRTISGAMDPQKGSIEFADKSITALDPDVIARAGISHVPEGREVFPFMTVEENLRMGAYKSSARGDAGETLEAVYRYFPALKARSGQPAIRLSGGEQQMLVVGRALMGQPRMILLDEPSLGLSPRLIKDIFEIIQRINAERGTTILLVEQNANVALSCAHFGYILEMGRIVLADTASRLREQDDVKEFYLGVNGQDIKGTRRWKRKKTWR